MVMVTRKRRKRSRLRDKRRIIVLKVFGGVGTIENSHINGPSGKKNSSYSSSKKKNNKTTPQEKLLIQSKI